MSYHKVNHVQRCSTMLILEVAFSTLLDIIFPPKENNYFALYDIIQVRSPTQLAPSW